MAGHKTTRARAKPQRGPAKKVPEVSRAALIQQQIAISWLAAPSSVETQRAYATELDVAKAASSNDPLATLLVFVRCIYAGITPPAFVLTLVAEWLLQYLEAGGAQSLDEAFGLQPIQKSGQPLNARKRQSKMDRYARMMWQLRKSACAKGKKLSIDGAAAEVIECLSLSETEESLVKHYGSNKVQERLDRLDNMLNADSGQAEESEKK